MLDFATKRQKHCKTFGLNAHIHVRIPDISPLITTVGL